MIQELPLSKTKDMSKRLLKIHLEDFVLADSGKMLGNMLVKEFHDEITGRRTKLHIFRKTSDLTDEIMGGIVRHLNEKGFYSILES